MRIAFIVESFPAWSEMCVLNQITGLLDLGHDVHIFASIRGSADGRAHPDIKRYGLLERTHYLYLLGEGRPRRIFRVGRSIIGAVKANPALVLRILKHCARERTLRPLVFARPFAGAPRYDIAQCHFGPSGNVGVLLKRFGLACRVVVTFHAYELSKQWSPGLEAAYKRLAEESDLFTPVSERWRGRLAAIGCPEDKLIVHLMGIDLRQFQFLQRPVGHALRVLTVARLVEKKGIEYGIRALALVRHQYPSAVQSLTIVGDGPLRQRLEVLVESLRLRDCIHFTGWLGQPEVRRCMYQSDVMLLPSVTASDGDQEGIPVSLMEAMATGMPVVSTWHSGIPELVGDGETGFLAPERDVEALGGCLKRFIDQPLLLASMGRAGRRFVEDRHDIAKLNHRLVSIYERVLAG